MQNSHKHPILFCKNIIGKGELSVEWCPIGDNIGDFMTKSTQLVAFKIFRYQLMGVNKEQDPGPVKPKNIMNIK